MVTRLAPFSRRRKERLQGRAFDIEIYSDLRGGKFIPGTWSPFINTKTT